MVGKYKFNAALDSLRLARGILAPNQADPFIERRLRRVVDRRNLFQWSMIDNEVGEYDNDYSAYVPYQSSQPLLMQHLPEAYGRDAYQHLMQAKPQRLKQITDLLTRSGIRVEATDDAWLEIINWLNAQCVPSKEPAALAHKFEGFFEFSIRPICYSLMSDVGLLLGEHALQLRPEFAWAYWGDVPMRNPADLGREAWILCDPAPKSGSFVQQPARFLPMKLVSTAARSERTGSTGFLSHLCG